MYLANELIRRLKRHHPDANIGVGILFRGYLMRALHAVLPADAWIANMENCGNSGPLMECYDGMDGRDLVVVPRIVDDGCELHMQMHASMFDRDQILTGAERFGVTGIIGQLGKERGQEYNTRFLADGSWSPDLERDAFYLAYLRRLYGEDAAGDLTRAYLLLEENERALVWWGRSEIFVSFHEFSPCQLRTDVDYTREPLDLDRAELKHAIDAPGTTPEGSGSGGARRSATSMRQTGRYHPMLSGSCGPSSTAKPPRCCDPPGRACCPDP